MPTAPGALFPLVAGTDEDVRRRECLAEAGLLHARGRTLQGQRKLAEAEECYQSARELAREADDPAVEAAMTARLGEICQLAGRLTVARDYYEASLAVLEDLGEAGRALRAEVLHHLGSLHQFSGRLAEAKECYRQSSVLRGVSGDTLGQSKALNNLGVIHALEQEWESAQACYRQSLELHRRAGDRLREGQMLQNLALLSDARGNQAAALRLVCEAASIFEEVGNEPARRYAYLLIARWER
jgi:tetratricopeptide (TPR) repeat protein